MVFRCECITKERADPADQDGQHTDRHQHCDGTQSVQDNRQGFFEERWHLGLTLGAVGLRHDEEEATLPGRHEPEQLLRVAATFFFKRVAASKRKGSCAPSSLHARPATGEGAHGVRGRAWDVAAYPAPGSNEQSSQHDAECSLLHRLLARKRA
jgi:hypothetical protein